MAIQWVKSSYSDEESEFERIVKEYSNAADVKKIFLLLKNNMGFRNKLI